MSQHIQTVCTITLGECMKAQNLPLNLYFHLVILQITNFYSICIYFYFYLKKIFSNKENVLILGPIISSVISIIFFINFL